MNPVPVGGIMVVSFKCSPIALRAREADRGRRRRPDGPPRTIEDGSGQGSARRTEAATPPFCAPVDFRPGMS